MKLKMSTFFLSVIEEVNKELESRGIIFKPKYYISNEWGCPDKVPIIGVPYPFCYPIFKTFEDDGVIVQKEPILKIVRHETGHAINYAYKLYEREDWKLVFGDFNKPYNLKEAAKHINPFSKDFVVNLPDYSYCYAQLHPDESWSETFAVWLEKKREQWKSIYKDRPAIHKLEFVGELIEKIKDKPPIITKGKLHKPYTSLIIKGG